MTILLAAFPILAVIFLMVFFRWTGQRAGPVAWLVGLAISISFFGMTFQAIWISQLKGIYLSLFVLAILWPALFLYRVVEKAGGIQAVANHLKTSIKDFELLVVGLAWAFSGMLEGLAGFGLPIAVVAPMLVSLGVNPVLAVAATAVGHAWSVTFGDMGVIFQTLVSITGFDANQLVAPAALILGVACVLCGWGVLLILGYQRYWLKVTGIGVFMAGVQFIFARLGLIPLSAFSAGLAGMIMILIWSRKISDQKDFPKELWAAIASYGGLAILLAVCYILQPINSILTQISFTFNFPEVSTLSGFISPSATQTLRPFLHPGLAILLTAVVSLITYRRYNLISSSSWRIISRDTWKTAAPTSLGIISMVGLSALMDHAGMMYVLAKALSNTAGATFPILSPLIGILGAFTTGSNNNSNVMFAPLQQQVAFILNLDRGLILAAQTAGGALGSMLAPAKIIVGCSTVGLKNSQGEVLRRTLGYGVVIGLLLGILTWLIIRF